VIEYALFTAQVAMLAWY